MEFESFSLNNKLVVEAYTKEGLKANVQGGFAFVEQKVKVKGLKLLMDAKLTIGVTVHTIPKGVLVYLKEEFLHNNQGVQKVYESDGVEGRFILIDLANVEFIGK